MNANNEGKNSFVVVANRLPVDQSPQGEWIPSPGGLVAALTPVLESHQGCWVGWPGVADISLEPFHTQEGILLHSVRLSSTDLELFYEGFSNATLWPLFHDLIVTPQYHRSWWEGFYQVNKRFAQATAEVAAPGATVWVQDYQLHLVPGMLRELRPDITIGFFLHIPFPHPDLFRQLPWREELLEGLLGADVIGFQTESSAHNFLLLADAPAATVGAFPISIAPCSLGEVNDQHVRALREQLGSPATVFLGVDRLDYTKGILQRLLALEELLEDGELSPEEVVLIQIATPSRERVEHYRRTRSAVEEAVGRINGRFSSLSQPVVHYFHRSFSKQLLHQYYRLADVMLVTPFKDGMNLVAKEYVATRHDGTGALVLSEFAGAAQELHQAHLCNPFDLESIKRAMLAALRNEKSDAQAAMRQMHGHVLTHDVSRWAHSFLTALDSHE